MLVGNGPDTEYIIINYNIVRLYEINIYTKPI